jgi:hypothetical protein
MKTDKVVKKLGAGEKLIPTVGLFPMIFPSHGINPTELYCIVWCIPSYSNLINNAIMKKRLGITLEIILETTLFKHFSFKITRYKCVCQKIILFFLIYKELKMFKNIFLIFCVLCTKT